MKAQQHTSSPARGFLTALALAACWAVACTPTPPVELEDDDDSGDVVAPAAGTGGAGMNSAGASGVPQGGAAGAPEPVTAGASGSGEGGSSSAGMNGGGNSPPQGGTGGTAGAPAAPAFDTRPIVSVSTAGYRLMVKRRNPDGSVEEGPFTIRGISWSPHGQGDGQDYNGNNFARFADQDFALMKAAGINAIRTYAPFPTSAGPVLDKALAHGIVVIMTVMIHFNDNRAMATVNAFKNHPAILMWMVGNEWNYNNLYSGRSWAECAARINEVIDIVKSIDSNHPVATCYGELPTAQQVEQIRADVWGLNVYSGTSFGNRFTAWKTRANKPFFFAEYGTDAWDSRNNREDQDTQARTLELLAREIGNNLSAKDPENSCAGGTPFELHDEWWKRGNPNSHDNAGIPLPALQPDGVANEEWWGILDIQRRPRKAYTALQAAYRNH